MNRNSVIVVLLGLAIVLSLAGCGSNKAVPTEVTAAGYPVTVTDAAGAAVTVTAKPQRIVSATLFSDELILALADSSNIRAINAMADDAAISNVTEAAKNVKLRVRAEPESIIAEQPDLVFIADWQPPELARILRDAHIAVYVYHTPNNITELEGTINDIARLIGEQARGERLVASMEAELATVAQKVQGVASKRRILQYSSYGSTSGRNTMFDDLVTKAGLCNVAADAGIVKYPDLPKEKIVALNPDIIFVPSWSGTGKPAAAELVDNIMADPSLSTVKAVQNHQIICIDDRHMNSVSQYAIYCVQDMAKAAYPELFKEQ